MSRYYPLARALGVIIVAFGLTMLLPILTSWLLHDGTTSDFDEAMFVTVSVGALLWAVGRRARRDLSVRDAFLLVVAVWTLLPVFAALPLLIFFNRILFPLSFTDAYFEAVSGLTTTGATVLSGLDGLPPSINLWRGELVWLGGMGLIVLAVAVLPMLGIGGRQMFKAETPGPMKDTKVTPRLTETARWLWRVYIGVTLLCLGAYWWAGMTPVDALMHAFTTMGLGGFSSHDASFGYWQSPAIEAVAIVFMTLAGMNFATHFIAFRARGVRGKLAIYRADPEARWYLVVLWGSVFAVTLFLWLKAVYPSWTEALRYAAFNVVSIATTTGFASVDYARWPVFAPLWMLFLCSFVTCSGSTGGGIKMMRAQILYKQVYRELALSAHPRAVYPVKISREPVSHNVLFSVLAFGFMYMVCIVSLTLLMTLSDLDIVTAVSAVVASINNTGPGLGAVGPAGNFQGLSDFQTWICTSAMLLGRLEIFSLLVVLTPAFWQR